LYTNVTQVNYKSNRTVSAVTLRYIAGLVPTYKIK